jgi:bifunctional non-homologous end joining protein LigD
VDKGQEQVLEVDGRAIKLSNQDRVLFPDEGLTKGDLVAYFRRVAERMLPGLARRPLTMLRWPRGPAAKAFFQKHAPDYFPDWIERCELELRGRRKGQTVRHPLCESTAALVYLANQGCFTLHVGLARCEAPTRPDRVVFDLDPSLPADFETVRFAALELEARLRALGLTPFATTTGSRGLHVVVPIAPELAFEEVRAGARAIAERLAADHPERLTLEVRKKQRGDRLFLDVLRNGYAQTVVAPYSIRPLPTAPVATPVAWDEVRDPDLGPRRYTVLTVVPRLAAPDPWAGMDDAQASLVEALGRL